MPALAANHPADMKFTGKAILPDRTVIVPVNRETGTVPAAWAGQLVELEGVDDVIIKFLRDGLE